MDLAKSEPDKQNTTMIHTCIFEHRVSTVQPPLLGGETRELLNMLDTYPGSSWFLMSLSVDGVDGAAHFDGIKTWGRVATHCEHGSLHQRSKCCTHNSSFPRYMVHVISHDQPLEPPVAASADAAGARCRRRRRRRWRCWACCNLDAVLSKAYLDPAPLPQ